MSDDRDQNNKSLGSDEEGDGSDGEDDELEPISNKDWFNLGGGGVGGGGGIREVLSLSQAT